MNTHQLPDLSQARSFLPAAIPLLLVLLTYIALLFSFPLGNANYERTVTPMNQAHGNCLSQNVSSHNDSYREIWNAYKERVDIATKSYQVGRLVLLADGLKKSAKATAKYGLFPQRLAVELAKIVAETAVKISAAWVAKEATVDLAFRDLQREQTNLDTSFGNGETACNHYIEDDEDDNEDTSDDDYNPDEDSSWFDEIEMNDDLFDFPDGDVEVIHLGEEL